MVKDIVKINEGDNCSFHVNNLIAALKVCCQHSVQMLLQAQTEHSCNILRPVTETGDSKIKLQPKLIFCNSLSFIDDLNHASWRSLHSQLLRKIHSELRRLYPSW